MTRGPRESIDSLARRLAASLPQGINALREDLEQNFRAVLKSGLDRMDLVTREEFDVQQAVLARTREKLEALEARLAGLERQAVPRKKAAKKAARKSAKKKVAGKTASKKSAGAKGDSKDD